MDENEIAGEFLLNEEQKQELVKRYADHENGAGRTHTLDETKAILEEALAARKDNGVCNT